MNPSRLTSYLFLALASLFWAGNMVMSRGLRADLPPVALAFWRWAIALLCVAPLAWPHLRSQWPLLRQAWKPVLLLGVCGIGCYNTLAYIALQSTTATNAALLNSFVPVVTSVLALLLFGKRLSRWEILGGLVSLAGVVLLISRGDVQTLLGLALNAGDLWMLGAVLAWSLYTVCLPLRPAGVHPMLLLAAFVVVGLGVTAPAYAWELATGPALQLHAASLAGIAYAGVVAAFLGLICFNAGVAVVGPAVGSLFIHLMPVFAAILSTFLLGEQPLWYHLVGMALVLGGIVLTVRRR